MTTLIELGSHSKSLSKSDVLSDDRIEELLQEAENRLRVKTQLQPASTVDELVLEEFSLPSESSKKVSLQKLQHGISRSLYLKDENGIFRTNSALMVPPEQRQMADGLRKTTMQEESKKVNDQTNSGPEWFNLPKTEITPALKRDLQLIEMRNVLDPHRHYKKNNRKGKIPTFSQTGTVVEGPTEWYSSRINKKDRSRTFVDEEMKNERATGRFKRKYGEIQEAKTSGKKGHYKKLLAKRKRKP